MAKSTGSHDSHTHMHREVLLLQYANLHFEQRHSHLSCKIDQLSRHSRGEEKELSKRESDNKHKIYLQTSPSSNLIYLHIAKLTPELSQETGYYRIHFKATELASSLAQILRTVSNLLKSSFEVVFANKYAFAPQPFNTHRAVWLLQPRVSRIAIHDRIQSNCFAMAYTYAYIGYIPTLIQ